MLQNQIGCDVEFIVGEQNEAIKAHKVVLASRSPVFFAMFDVNDSFEATKKQESESNPDKSGNMISLKTAEKAKNQRSESQASIKSNMSTKSTSISIGRGEGWIDMKDSSTFTKQPFSNIKTAVRPPDQPEFKHEINEKKVYEIANTDFYTFKLFLRFVTQSLPRYCFIYRIPPFMFNRYIPATHF